MNEPADYEETEQVVLSRWDKLKAWWEIGSTAVKVVKLAILGIKLLFVGSATAVVVGEVTDTKPIRAAAVEVGVLGEKPPLTIDQLWVQVMQLEEDIEILKLPHEHDYPATIIGERGAIGPPGRQGLTGAQGIQGETGKDGIDGKDGINGIEGSSQIDDAFNRHKLDDH